MRPTTILTSLFSMTLLTGAAAAQSVVTLYPTADSHTRDIAPGENNGSSDVIWIGRGAFWDLGNIRTFVRFDLLGLLPASPNVVSAASLSAYQFGTEPAAGGLDTNVHRVTANWTENTVTWANQPAYDSQVWATAQTGDSFYHGWIDWDVTALVQSQITSRSHLGWMFKNTFESAGASRLGYFHSREYAADPSLRLQLNVEVTGGDAPSMTLSYDALRAGQTSTFVVRDAMPNQRVYFIYSLTGLGTQTVPQLGVTLGLRRPTSAGDALADGGGRATLSRRIPGSGAGRPVWIQAAQQGAVSNIAAGKIQ